MAEVLRERQGTYLCTGDNICLYCSDTGGYVFCDRTCSAQNQLYTYYGQDREKPENVPNPQVLAFQVRIQSRYKLGKKYRKLLEDYGASPDEDAKEILEEAKLSAEAEHQDNVIEQNRLHGKPLRYGAIIQLRHVFTEKYIHVDNTRTSCTDKSHLLIHLQAYDGKSAQFRLLPRYKVNSEGEEVRVGDQVTLEGVKSPGQYLHASPPFTFGARGLCSEVNIGVNASSLTIVQRFSPNRPEFTENSIWNKDSAALQGGAVVQMRHRHLEGYLSAEGVFVKGVKENVHLRVREADLLCPRTLYPPSSCATLWQIEDERSILLGNHLKWEQRVRLRHMSTQMYLAADPSLPESVFLTHQCSDPRTVFRLHAKNKEQGEIPDSCTTRIEAAMSSTWLHGNKDYDYLHTSDAWIRGTWKKVSVSKESHYMDAFHIRLCPFTLLLDYNYLSGMMPLLSAMSTQESCEFKDTDDKSTSLMTSLTEIAAFLVAEVSERQNRRKLLREMQILEVLVSLLQTINTWPCRAQQKNIFEAIYNIFYHCIVGGTNDDSLYLAQYLDFFLSQIKLSEGFGFFVTRMLVELIRDRREVVERITPRQIDSFISLLKKYPHHRYIQLLSALCVVDGLALPSNQSRICDRLIQKNKGSVLNIRAQNGMVYVSQRNSIEEVALSTFIECSKSNDDAAFLEEQLLLYQRLCYGRNQHCIDTISKETETITWDVVMTVMTSRDVTDDVKAQFLDLMIALFIDVGENTSYSEIITNTFVYKTVTLAYSDNWLRQQFNYLEPETEKRIPQLTDWITDFLDRNRYMIASRRSRNLLILSVLRVVRALLTYGYLKTSVILQWLDYIINIMNGAHDLPKLQRKTSRVFKNNSEKSSLQTVADYRHRLRFEPSEDTTILVDAKYEALEILDVLLHLSFNFRVQKLVALYKDTEQKWEDPKARSKTVLLTLLKDSFKPVKSRWSFWDPVEEVSKQLNKVFDVDVLKEEQMIYCLMDLARYKYPKITAKALMLLQRYFTVRSDVINAAKDAKLMRTSDSLALYKTCQTFMPLLHRLLAVKLYDDQMHLVSAILDRFKECCRQSGDDSKPNIIGQQVLVSHDILPLLMSILERQSSSTEETATQAEKSLVSNTLQLLQLMAEGNPEVQRYLMTSLGTLLSLKVAPVQLAETLKEVLYKNAAGAWGIKSEHVKTVVKLISTHQDRVPAFVEVLCRLIVVDEEGSAIRRSQTLVMKHFLEGYPSDAYIFELAASSRRSTLLLQEGHGLLEYFINLLNLLIYCGQGTRGIIRSFCQNVFSLSELLSLLANPDICTNLKRPLLHYLSVIYLEAVESHDQRTQNMMHTSELWAFLKQLSADVDFCLQEMAKAGLQRAPIPETLNNCYIPDSNASMDVMHCKLFYLTDAVFHFLVEFFRFYVRGSEQYPEEGQILLTLTGSLMALCPMLAGSFIQPKHYRTMRGAMQRLMMASGHLQMDIESCIQSMEAARGTTSEHKSLRKMPSMLDVEGLKEIRLNNMLHVFMMNANSIYLRPDTVGTQLNLNDSKLKNRAYAYDTTGSNLPLEDGFQEHVCQFIVKNRDLRTHFAKTEVLLRQLRTSAQRVKSSDNDPVMDAVDIRCLQILRATLHNLIVTLPSNWNLKTSSLITRRLRMIRSLQEYYVEHGLVDIAFSLLNKQNTMMLREVLSLLCCLLFNANSSVQDCSLKYFESTREEVFFMVLIEQFHRSASIIKERRAFQVMKRKQESLLITSDNDGDLASLKSDHHIETSDEDGPESMFTSGEDGAIMLMLAVLALMCDGQHRGMQDYLRYQPDNLRSFNVVAEASHFLSLLATNINDKNIELATQLLVTLNEMIQGNQENRVVTLNTKIVDFINSIIRSSSNDGCSHSQMLTLYRAVADLIYSLLEESGPEALKVAKEVAATIDVKAILRILSMCHDTHTAKSWKVGRRFMLKRSNKVGSQESATMSKYENEKVRSTAMKFYIIASRVNDVAPDRGKRVMDAEANHSKAIAAYKSSVASVEVVKNDHLQKVYFPIPQRSQIRHEVKEKLLWGIDRTSPTNKIRDFVRWSNMILKELLYNRKVLSNPISMFISSQWMLWNYAIIFLSVVINVIMLVTWEAKVSMKDVPPNASTLPTAIDDYIPKHILLSDGDYRNVILVLGALHNAFSLLLLISYFLLNNPKMPKFTGIRRFFRKLCKGKNEEVEQLNRTSLHAEDMADVDNHVFTMTTVFILILVGSSFAGTLTNGYFFAVHLLNIVNTNELLKGVIKAVTQNGRSLIWVAILGMIMMYLYALIGFAFLRSSFSPDNFLYCDTLYECSVTLIRYGLIGDIDEKLAVHPLKNSFTNFGFMVLYQVTFFIFFTTIGLNIIFGIIVDTFSELRDLKWRAEKDMQETCFICNRQSYDFEHFSKGFRHHVRKEHNIWSYIHYFLYLVDTNPNEYTSLDAYVASQIKSDQYDFFPLNRALSLANMDEEMGETKLDTVADEVSFLVKKHHEESASRVLQMERFQNERWKEGRMFEAGLLNEDDRRQHRLRTRVRRSIRTSTVMAGGDVYQESPRGSVRRLNLADVLEQARAAGLAPPAVYTQAETAMIPPSQAETAMIPPSQAETAMIPPSQAETAMIPPSQAETAMIPPSQSQAQPTTLTMPVPETVLETGSDLSSVPVPTISASIPEEVGESSQTSLPVAETSESEAVHDSRPPDDTR